jgi:hypothetical protein
MYFLNNAVTGLYNNWWLMNECEYRALAESFSDFRVISESLKNNVVSYFPWTVFDYILLLDAVITLS